jgi:predicted NBD/HSP70 family sugar kinase
VKTSADQLGDLLELIISSGPVTRAELMDQTGLSRTTLGARLKELVGQRLVAEAQAGPSTGGRPPTGFVFNAGAGVVLAVDAGVSRSAVAVFDLAGESLAEYAETRPIGTDPTDLLGWAGDHLESMLTEHGRSLDDVRAVGVALPGSVDFATGRPVSPLLMPGWDDFPVAETLSARFGADVLVDNDVNVMALGEGRPGEQVVVVKAGTGIGLGSIFDGIVQRGAQGCAGDVGHIRVPDFDEIVCRCGKRGCVQAVAGGRAMAQRLREAGIDCDGAADVATLARAGTPEAIASVRAAGQAIGFVLAAVVNIMNPTRLVVAGDLTDARDYLLGALREIIYRESNPLATSELDINRARAGRRAGLIGASKMAVDHALASRTIASFGTRASDKSTAG